MSNNKKTNILAENMLRFGTKNLNEDHPGIVPSVLKIATGATYGLVSAVKLYSKMFTGKSAEEQKQVRMVMHIQNMIMKDNDPDDILKYMKSVDSNIDDATGIEIMKVLGSQLGLYVDPEDPNDATPLT